MSSKRDLGDIVTQVCDQHRFRFEGEKGVENLARLSRILGYRDPMNQLYFADGCIGDFLTFLADNPGAQEAIVDWIANHTDSEYEWKEALYNELSEDEDDSEDEDE